MNTKHASGYWQTRSVEFDKKEWLALRPDGKTATTVTQQSMAEVIAIVWGEDDAEAEANARLIAAAPDIKSALEGSRQFLAAWRYEYASKPQPQDRHAKAQLALIDKQIAATEEALSKAQPLEPSIDKE